MWKRIFEMVHKVNDLTKPLTPQILSDPDHDFVKTLIYVYSMDSFIYQEMNKASRTKDESKIMYYGAFASALGFIIHQGNLKKSSCSEYLKVYRGLQLSNEVLEQKYQVG